MDKTQARELIQKYNEGTASKEDVKLLANWYAHESALQQADPEDQDYLMINQEIWLNIKNATMPQKSKSLWPRIAVAASVLICVGIGFYFYGKQGLAGQEIVQDFEPGKQTATLTLGDGKRIVLTDKGNGAIASQAGVQVSKTADGKLIYTLAGQETPANPVFNMLSTAKAEQYQLVLPDGSKVWLNAASSLKFPASFAGQSNRKVELKGEAYFEVAKDKKHPFIVATAGQLVEVLGTHFNISSYTDEEAIKTTLLEGAVKVTIGSGDHAIAEAKILRPNQQSVLYKTSRNLSVNTVDPDAVVAWKNGLFQFENADIKTVMRQLSRWYDIDVAFAGATPRETFSGKVYRNMSLSKVLDVLSFSQINFKIEGRRMIISPTKE